MDAKDNKRIEYRIPANLMIDGLDSCQTKPDSLQATIRELSASGCRLQSSLDLKLGQSLEISFNLTGEHHINCVKVRVIRRLSQRSHRVVALEFVDLPDEDQQRIREYVIWKESQEEIA